MISSTSRRSRTSESSSSRQGETAAPHSGAAVHPLTRGETAALGLLFGSVAFAFSPSLDSQFTLPKLAAFYVCLPLLLVTWIRRSRSDGVAALPGLVSIATGALALWWIVTLPFAVHIRTALWGAVGRGNGLVLHLSLLLLFATLGSMRIGAQDVRRILHLLLAAMALLSGYALVQAAGLDLFVWPNVRPASTIGHPVPLGAILALGVPIGLAEALAARRKSSLIAVGAATALIVFALGTTLSRGPWIGAAAGVAMVIALALRGSARRVRISAIAGAAAVVIAATVWIGRVPGTRITQRIALLTRLTTDPSFMNRFEYFSAALTMIRDRPLTGSGFETFGLLFPPLRPIEDASVDENTIPTMVHNGLLQTAQATGIPGAILSIGLQLTILLALRPLLIRRDDDGDGEAALTRMLAIGCVGGLAAFWIQDLSGWEEVSSSVFFWAVAGCAVALLPMRADVRKKRIAGERLATAASLVCAAIAVIAWSTVRELEADAVLHRAAIRAGRGEWPAPAADLAAISRSVNDAIYLDRAATIFLTRLRAGFDPEAYRSAMELLRRAGAANRFDPYVLLHLIDAESLAMLATRRTVAAPDVAEAAERVLAMDRNNATVRETLARFRFAAGDLTSALEQIHTAERLRPRTSGFRLLEGDILRAQGQADRALQAYRAETAIHAEPDAVWIAAQRKVTASLIEAGDYQSARREAERLLEKAPADPIGTQLLEAARR